MDPGILTVLLEFYMKVGGVDLALWQDAKRCTVQVMVGTREAERCLPPVQAKSALGKHGDEPLVFTCFYHGNSWDLMWST